MRTETSTRWQPRLVRRRDDEILTATHMLNIIGRGEVSDSIRLVERFRDGKLISREFGSYELP